MGDFINMLNEQTSTINHMGNKYGSSDQKSCKCELTLFRQLHCKKKNLKDKYPALPTWFLEKTNNTQR